MRLENITVAFFVLVILLTLVSIGTQPTGDAISDLAFDASTLIIALSVIMIVVLFLRKKMRTSY